jgi:hypothetical protein
MLDGLPSLRPSVQTLGSSPLPSAGTDMGSSAARNGAVTEFSSAPELNRAVAPSTGAARADAALDQPFPDDSYTVESAKARAEAAHRAYTMVSLVAGVNPLSDPVP